MLVLVIIAVALFGISTICQVCTSILTGIQLRTTVRLALRQSELVEKELGED